MTFTPTKANAKTVSYNDLKAELTKVAEAIEKGSCALLVGKRSWYKLTLDMQQLVWSRNLADGWDIHVYTTRAKRERHIGTIHYRQNEPVKYRIEIYE